MSLSDSRILDPISSCIEGPFLVTWRWRRSWRAWRWRWRGRWFVATGELVVTKLRLSRNTPLGNLAICHFHMTPVTPGPSPGVHGLKVVRCVAVSHSDVVCILAVTTVLENTGAVGLEATVNHNCDGEWTILEYFFSREGLGLLPCVSLIRPILPARVARNGQLVL